MKKVLFVAIILFMLYTLTGCEKGKINTVINEDNYISPNIERLGDNPNDMYYDYIVDKDTGVVYLEIWGYNYYGITVMFNSDGTLMKEKDIRSK